jgi:hypothetical protein
MKLKSIFLALGLVVCTTTFSQSTQKPDAPSPKVMKANETLMKINRLDICKFVLPLLLNKSQLNELLITLEKCRKAEKDMLEKDADEIAKIDGKVSKALDEAVKDGNYPSKELQKEVIAVTQAIANRRLIVTGNMVTLMNETVRKHLNGGQIKAMSNLVDPKSLDASLKPESWTDEEKVNFYIRRVMLDLTTYELLKILYKQAKD